MARILVVDDEGPVREALVAQIERIGHRCAEAANGLEALERLHEREYDVVITDVMMPQLNGFQFISRVMPYLEERVPIIILSSVDDQDGIAAAVQAGAFDYLTKPVELSEARAVLDSALERRAEMVRLHGRWQGRGGPIPAEALGARPEDVREADPEQEPAGVPVFRDGGAVVSVPPPADRKSGLTEPSGDLAHTTFLDRLLGLFRRRGDAA
jgi:CheY-like chemotaxis protein